jgi:hypothetical protein
VDIAWHMPAGVGIHGFAGRIAEPEVAPTRTTQVTTRSAECDYSQDVLVLGRLKSGTAPESRRVVHVFQAVPELLHNAVVAARCGARLAAGDLQWLPRFMGMPCERCVMTP